MPKPLGTESSPVVGLGFVVEAVCAVALVCSLAEGPVHQRGHRSPDRIVTVLAMEWPLLT